MFKKYIFLAFLFLSFQTTFSQSIKLSSKAEVSFITVGPGKVLYEKFGHSAIRIKDSANDIDIIYNYGFFDFDAPNFILNFTKGKLIYKLAAYPFHYFVRSNNEDKRWMKEQVLNLTEKEVQTFFVFLNNNAQPKNASYEYDPFFNNCATKLRDISKNILVDKITLSDDFVTKKQSLRQLMNKEIHYNTWGSLGINVALGSKLDRIITAEEYQYLPDYVYAAFKNGTILRNGKTEPLIKKEHTILNFEEIKPKNDFISPLLVFSLFLLLGLYICYRDYKNKTRTKWFDFLLFFSTGLVGVLVVFLWFFTNHSTTPTNFNFLWAFAPNLVIAFTLLKNTLPKWIKGYLFFLILLLLLIPFVWIAEVQLYSLSLIPIFIILIIRYYLLQKSL